MPQNCYVGWNTTVKKGVINLVMREFCQCIKLAVHGNQIARSQLIMITIECFTKGNTSILLPYTCTACMPCLASTMNGCPHVIFHRISQEPITVRTAIQWLYLLGFRPTSHKKEAYVECDNIVSHKKKLLDEIKTPSDTHLPPSQEALLA